MRRVIIDTDPGQDDAVALLLALASPELEVQAITVVAGNVPLERTVHNALVIRDLARRPGVPVYAGAAQPLVRPLVTAEYVHGVTGLDGAELPAPLGEVAPGHAADAIIEIVRASPPNTVTLCTLGPLTNVALALDRDPGLAERLEGIVMMGGGFFEGGNVTPAAEFNIYVDPQAAARVFDSGVSLTMMPLDVTHQVLASAQRVDRFRAMGTRVGEVVAAWLDFFDRYDTEKYGTDGAPLHDPCVIAYLLRPDLFDGQVCNVEIETSSELTMGMTVVDWWHVTDRAQNALVMANVDADRFFDLLVDRIGALP
ncbi:MAG: nucleoside hydrolase [Acidimicrobiia bacterium]|nr:nucleoside hydrolase [Acidimicrobiia bacterium]